MESYRPALERWCEHEWGQLPQAISEWHADEDMAQVFMRLNRSVLIADFVVENDGSLECKEHLQIPLDRWNPGSIQAFEPQMGEFVSVIDNWKFTWQLVCEHQNGVKRFWKNGS
jgi:hypothetical protein